MEQYKTEDRALIVRDIVRNKPDIILIGDAKWHNMAFSHADLRAALGAYRDDQKVNGVEIWLRKPGG
jgi:exonuclease III